MTSSSKRKEKKKQDEKRRSNGSFNMLIFFYFLIKTSFNMLIFFFLFLIYLSFAFGTTQNVGLRTKVFNLFVEDILFFIFYFIVFVCRG